MNEPWRVELFGRLRAEQGDREITRFRTQKFGALFAYMAYYLNQSHPREVLIEMLWPEVEPVIGKDRLSTALSSLRHQLEPPGVPAGAVLIADRFMVRLNPAAVTTDVMAFEALLDGPQVSDAGERIQTLSKALDLYKGPLLPGYYEEWMGRERERLAETYQGALRRMMRLLVQQRDLGRAIDYGHRAIQADPLREEAHRDLIRLLIATNQPSAALRQYRELEQLLKKTLGQTPSPSTRALVRQLHAESEEVEEKEPPKRGRRPQVTPASSQVSSAPVFPSGTITFLLTGRAGDRTPEDAAKDTLQGVQALPDLLRQEFLRHGGHIVKEGDDGFQVAFERAADALAAAIAAQRRVGDMEREKRSPSPSLSIRMALHTGDVERQDGEDNPRQILDHASRILAAAHDGQILCSQATAELLRRSLEPGVRLTDLGLYRLRDVSGAERLCQVEWPEMPQREFPLLLAEAGSVTHLPLQFTRFFGRKVEIARLVGMLTPRSRPLSITDGEDTDSPLRLLTLSGPGGGGKTRLSLEVAGRLVEMFEGAVWFVPLADVADARLIAGAIVDALRISRSPQKEPMEQAVEALSRQSSLLVLDNFEQLVEEGAAVVRTLLDRLPQLTCLVTSRRLLGLTGEREWEVPPLSIPQGKATPEQLTLYESVQLFVDRAQTVRPDFQVTHNNADAVAELCDRLEGIPLALELAAARAQVLTPMQMLSQLERRFDFLVSRKRDVAERHRTLWAAIEWSYRLLSPELQEFFKQLSVFRGGWSLEAAEAICRAGEPIGLGPCPGMALDHLAQLRECSLVLTDDSGPEMRFRMLETLREFGQEHMNVEERRALEMRHRDYYLHLAETGEAQLQGAEQAGWLNRLESDHDNLRAALDGCSTDPEDSEPGLRLSATLYVFWWIRGHIQEGRERLNIALSHPKASQPSAARARALQNAGDFARRQGDYPAAEKLFEETLAIRRTLQDAQGVARALSNLGLLAGNRGDYLSARTLLEEVLAILRELGDKASMPKACFNLGCVVQAQGDNNYAGTLFEEALALFRELQDPFGISMTLNSLGNLKMEAEEYDAAWQLFEESLAIQRDLRTKEGLAITLLNLALLAQRNGALAEAENHLAESLALFLELGDRGAIAWGLEMPARWRASQNQPERAVRLLGAAQALRESIGHPLVPNEIAAHETLLANLRAALGKEKFAVCWEEGSVLTMEQAVAYALERESS